MNRRRGGSLAGNPLLIGAITTLIVVVAVFLSYNANNGLPFVPTYDIKVALPDASGLQKSNQVKIAGTRVGVIDSISAHEDPRTGRILAVASLKLEKNVEPLPADTHAVVQSVSAIGLKYLELEKGTAQAKLKPGATIPVAQTREPVDIDQFFNMFDKPTRKAIKISTNEFGNGLAGRGLGLNNTIHELRPLVINAIPALRNLAAPQTNLHELWVALERASNQAAPVADTQAAFYTDLDIFFAAWAGVSRSLEEATQGGPPSLEQAIHSLPFEGPFTQKATLFMHLLRPSAAALVTVAPPLGHAFKEGATNLKEATTLNSRLAESSQALSDFGRNPVVTLGLEDFTETLRIGEPLLAGIAPEQAICNYWTLAFRNVASLESGTVGAGTLARAQLKLAPTGPNNEGYPSSAIANGPSTEHLFHSPQIIDNNHVHANPYPNVGGPGQPQLCEAGNESWLPGKAITGNLPASAVSASREITNRETNLFGETYSPETLKALGVSKAKAPAEPAPETVAKKGVKKKGKKK
jgi:virulence factor Mce-like protein